MKNEEMLRVDYVIYGEKHCDQGTNFNQYMKLVVKTVFNVQTSVLLLLNLR